MFGSLTAVRMMVLVAKAGNSECTVKSQNMCLCVLGCVVVSDSLQPYRLDPTRLLYLWDFPGKNTGVVYHFLFQGIFPAQGSKLLLLMSPESVGGFFTMRVT